MHNLFFTYQLMIQIYLFKEESNLTKATTNLTLQNQIRLISLVASIVQIKEKANRAIYITRVQLPQAK